MDDTRQQMLADATDRVGKTPPGVSVDVRRKYANM